MKEIGDIRRIYGIRDQYGALRDDYYSALDNAMTQIHFRTFNSDWKYHFYRALLF